MNALLERLQRLSLRRRLQLGFGGILLLMTLLSVYSLGVQHLQKEQMRRLYEQDMQGLLHIEAARAALADMGQDLREAVFMRQGPARAEALYQLAGAHTLVRREIELARTRIYRDAIVRSLAEFELAFSDYERRVDTIAELLETKADSGRSAADLIVSPEFQRADEAAKHALERVERLKREGADDEVKNANARYLFGVQLTVWLLILGLVAGVLFGSLISRTIRRPAAAFRRALDSLSAGQLDIAVPYTEYPNEAGELARAIVTLRDEARQMAARRWVKTHVAAIAGELQSLTGMDALADRFLCALAPLLAINHGALYIFEPGMQRLRLTGSYAAADAREFVMLGEGLVGQCALDGKTLSLREVPADYLKIASGLGGTRPAQLVVMAILRNDRPLGVVELASLSPFDEAQLELLDELMPLLAMNVDLLERAADLRSLLAKSQEHAELAARQATTLSEKTRELEATQRAIEAARAWYRGIIESAPDGMMIVDQEGRILLANPRLETIFGYAKGELDGVPVEQLVPAGIHGKHRGLRGAFFAEGVSRKMGRGNVDLRGRRRDGSELSVEIGVSFLPELDGQGRCVCAAVRDVSERRMMEMALVQSQERLQTILDNSPISIAVSTQGRICFANPKFVETFGTGLGDSTAPIYVETAARAHIWATLAREGSVTNEEIRMHDAQRRERDMVATFLPIDFDGEAGVLAWLLDVTEARAAEAAIRHAKEVAEEATRAKSAFLANMSHEIRTPMNAIIGMSHLALESSQDARQRGYLENIHRSAENLLRIINDILDFSRIEAGGMSLERVAFNLDDVIGQVAGIIGLKAQEKGLDLLFEYGAGLRRYWIGDPLRLGQILINLGNNAVKFTEHGAIVVGIEQSGAEGDEVILHARIRDTGIGMTEEQCQRIFHPFVQADSSTTRKYGGSGLGLAISKTLAEMMGGTIWVDSAPGQGSTFHVEVRVGAAPEGAGERPWLAPAGTRLLVVEGGAVTRAVVAGMARRLGFEVDAVASDEQTQQQLADARDAARPYSVVLIDARLPGFQTVIDKLKQPAHATGAEQLVVIAFVQGDDAAIAHAMEVDARLDVLTKPITPKGLRESLRNALAPALAGSTQMTAHPSQPEAVSLAGSRVLLVEDNDLNRELATELLRRAGIEVVTAGNGREALERLRQDADVDGVLMDCQMPVMDGYAATRAIREQLHLTALPIIAMTADALAADRERAIAAGMNDHIAKPLDIRRMFATMARWIKPRHAESASPGPGGETVVASAVLPGIDQAAGLRTCGDNASLYRRLLHLFLESNAHFEQSFHQARQGDDASVAYRMAHTLRGSAANIGAIDVAAAAGELQHACKEGAPPEEVERLLNKLMKALGPVLDGLSRYDAPPAS
ncbi:MULTISPECIES: response regulator [unclassified Dyella]|jgi:PAS domain S-box-containing protein|uniref:response regulator n=1 Tax=unclassified Dyella TaxID=2634549 RepID=UPI003F9386EE